MDGSGVGRGWVSGVCSMVAEKMITEYQVQRTPEECARHLLLEIVMTACNDWLIARERNWQPAEVKGKWPHETDLSELHMFFANGWCDRLLHMANSSLCGRRILSALEKKPRMEFSKKKQSDRASESCMLHGSDEVCVMTGEPDVISQNMRQMSQACTAWLERREDNYRPASKWNDLDFTDKQNKLKRSNQNQTNQ